MIEYYRNKISNHFISFHFFAFIAILFIMFVRIAIIEIFCATKLKYINQVEKKFTTVPRKVVIKIELCYNSSTERELDQIFLR